MTSLRVYESRTQDIHQQQHAVSEQLIMLVQIDELTGEHASEHFAARAAIFSERLEYSLTALLKIRENCVIVYMLRFM